MIAPEALISAMTARRITPLVSILLGLALAPTAAGAFAQAKPGSSIPGSPVATAQTPLPARWWRDGVITSQLGLTKAQADRIDATFEAFLPGQRSRWTELRRREDELSDLLRQPAPSEANVTSQIDLVEMVRFEVNRNRQLMLFRIRQVLSPAQRQKLDLLDGSAANKSSAQH
jgi:Spy/CpxP family protein refolding chaperone